MEPRISESKFGRISKMAAADRKFPKFDLDHGGSHFESMGAAIFFCLRMRVRTPKFAIFGGISRYDVITRISDSSGFAENRNFR